MKLYKKAICICLSILFLTAPLTASAFAKQFAPSIDASNIGVNTQYLYSSNDPSWLRQLTVKEDMLSVGGIINEATLHPVCDYPYTTDAPTFEATVTESVRLYTLDEDSQRAAYLYFIEQIGALSIISDPSATDESKAEWLRQQGIVITEEDEKDPDKILMISALYALMKNDFYYVYKGEHLTIPQGTPLEEAMVMYLKAFSGQENSLSSFLLKFFGNSSITNLEDYIYYTSLMTLYTRGYISPAEIPMASREEVYRRVAIMTIRSYGIAIDSETATTEEIRQKYLTAMLGTHYKVTLDPTSLLKAQKKERIPFYILQRMAIEDANLTISQTKYSYEDCFALVRDKTQRFDLEKEFYSDIYEYNVYLANARNNISINPTPISGSGTSIFINGFEVSPDSYAVVELTDATLQTINIVSRQTTNKKTHSTAYKLNVYQGTTVAPDSNLTGIVPTVGNDLFSTEQGNAAPGVSVSLPELMPVVTAVNGVAMNIAGGILSLNDKGQLVDQEGNIISNSTYETLPEGYKYVVGKDGIITIVYAKETTTEPTTADDGEDKKESARKIIIIVSIVCLAGVSIAIIIILVYSKKGKTKAEKMKKRRAREKSKKAKKEARGK